MIHLLKKNDSFDVVTKDETLHVKHPINNTLKQWYEGRKNKIKAVLIIATLSTVIGAPALEALNTKQMIDNTKILNTDKDYSQAGFNVKDIFNDTFKKISHLYINQEQVDIDKLKRITDVIYENINPDISGKENYQILRNKDLVLAEIASKNGVSAESVKNTFLPEVYNQSVKTLDDLDNIKNSDGKITKQEKLTVLMQAAYNPFIPANIRYNSALQLEDMLKDKDLSLSKNFLDAQQILLANTFIKLSANVNSSPEIKLKSRIELQKMINEQTKNSNIEVSTLKNNKY